MTESENSSPSGVTYQNGIGDDRLRDSDGGRRGIEVRGVKGRWECSRSCEGRRPQCLVDGAVLPGGESDEARERDGQDLHPYGGRPTHLVSLRS